MTAKDTVRSEYHLQGVSGFSIFNSHQVAQHLNEPDSYYEDAISQFINTIRASQLRKDMQSVFSGTVGRNSAADPSLFFPWD